MIAIILAILDLNAFGECFKGVLQGGDLILNLIVTILMIVQVIATIFSGIDYMKGAKKYIKDQKLDYIKSKIIQKVKFA